MLTFFGDSYYYYRHHQSPQSSVVSYNGLLFLRLRICVQLYIWSCHHQINNHACVDLRARTSNAIKIAARSWCMAPWINRCVYNLFISSKRICLFCTRCALKLTHIVVLTTHTHTHTRSRLPQSYYELLAHARDMINMINIIAQHAPFIKTF